MDCSRPGCSVYGLLQTRILEWVAMPFTGDLPDQGLNPCLVGLRASAGGFFSISANWEAQASLVPSKKKKFLSELNIHLLLLFLITLALWCISRKFNIYGNPFQDWPQNSLFLYLDGEQGLIKCISHHYIMFKHFYSSREFKIYKHVTLWGNDPKKIINTAINVKVPKTFPWLYLQKKVFTQRAHTSMFYYCCCGR